MSALRNGRVEDREAKVLFGRKIVSPPPAHSNLVVDPLGGAEREPLSGGAVGRNPFPGSLHYRRALLNEVSIAAT